MLDVRLRNVSFRHREGFALGPLDADFARSTHTAIAGPPGCGASTLLRLIAGTLDPLTGDVILGDRRVNRMKASLRPILFAGPDSGIPARWSVEHALVAAVRTRSLDRIDRLQELKLATAKWGVDRLLARKIGSLSSHERLLLDIARVDLTRPAILVADRFLAAANSSSRRELADAFYRTLRVHGTTVISAPASRDEIAVAEQLVVLDGGSLVQRGHPREIHLRPASEAAALTTGEADAIPVTLQGATVESAIGTWELEAPPFQGTGVAIVRPEDFSIAGRGEESDLIFGIEEAGFSDGRWLARGLLSGGISLRIELASSEPVHKGRLLALRYDPQKFTLLPRALAAPAGRIPTGVVPPMRESR